MSYILEAQRRDEAAVDPDAAAQWVLDEDRQSRRRWVLWLIGFALLANAGIIAYLFGPWNTIGAKSSAPSTSAPSKATRELVVKPRERTGPTAASRPERFGTTERAPSARTKAQARTRAQTPGATPGTTAALTQAETSTGNTKGRVLSPEEAARLNIGQADAPAPSPDTAQNSALPAAVAPTEPQPSAAKKTKSKVPETITLAQLSAKDREEFPELEFSTHVFADDPALRAVVVNARRLSEGESIGEMVLRAVTEDGIIVDYRGKRVAVSVMDTWQ